MVALGRRHGRKLKGSIQNCPRSPRVWVPSFQGFTTPLIFYLGSFFATNRVHEVSWFWMHVFARTLAVVSRLEYADAESRGCACADRFGPDARRNQRGQTLGQLTCVSACTPLTHQAIPTEKCAGDFLALQHPGILHRHPSSVQAMVATVFP